MGGRPEGLGRQQHQQPGSPEESAQEAYMVILYRKLRWIGDAHEIGWHLPSQGGDAPKTYIDTDINDKCSNDDQNAAQNP